MFVPRPERTERRSQRLKHLFQPLRLQQGMPQPRVVERRMIGNLEPFRRRRRRKEYCVGIELKEERSKDLKEQLQQRLLLKEEQWRHKLPQETPLGSGPRLRSSIYTILRSKNSEFVLSLELRLLICRQRTIRPASSFHVIWPLRRSKVILPKDSNRLNSPEDPPAPWELNRGISVVIKRLFFGIRLENQSGNNRIFHCASIKERSRWFILRPESAVRRAKERSRWFIRRTIHMEGRRTIH